MITNTGKRKHFYIKLHFSKVRRVIQWVLFISRPIRCQEECPPSGSGVALSRQIRLMTADIRGKLGMKLASKGAAGKALRAAGKAAGKVMGKLFGPAIAMATVAWDVWDHRRSEKEYRPILKEDIRSYFVLVKDTMLNDKGMGILGVILEMEEKILESMQAGQAG